MTSPPNKYRTKVAWLAEAIKKHKPNECMMWPWACDKDGYGLVSTRAYGDMVYVKAHRLSFYLVHGHWPEPCALHTCDTPGCFNPDHIYEGDSIKNHEDMVSRGRSTYGERHPGAILTDKLVIQMRKEYAVGKKTCGMLAEHYGVGRAAAQLAISGKTWKHLGGAIKPWADGTKPRTHCKRGHPLIPENCYIRGNGSRCCKVCVLARSKMLEVAR